VLEDEEDGDFWASRSCSHPPLAEYPIRLATTVANTTISERSFSELKRSQTRLRNRLTIERLDKLIYISMNADLVLGGAEAVRATKKRKRLDDEFRNAGTTPEQLVQHQISPTKLLLSYARQ
jgi:hypothetical protein